MTYEIHPFAEKFPLLPEEELNSLAADIKANGQRLPIIRWQGKIIDGRNRLKACEIAGVEPNIKDKDDAFKSDAEVAGFVISMNIARRHISASERATIAVELFEILNKENQPKSKIKVSEELPAVEGETPSDTPEEVAEEKPKKNKGEILKEAAEATHTNTTYVNQAKKIKEEAPEKFKEVQAGTKTIPEALKEMKDEEPVDEEQVTPEKALKIEEKKEAKAKKLVEQCSEKLEELGYRLIRTAIEKI